MRKYLKQLFELADTGTLYTGIYVCAKLLRTRFQVPGGCYKQYQGETYLLVKCYFIPGWMDYELGLWAGLDCKAPCL